MLVLPFFLLMLLNFRTCSHTVFRSSFFFLVFSLPDNLESGPLTWPSLYRFKQQIALEATYNDFFFFLFFLRFSVPFFPFFPFPVCLYMVEGLIPRSPGRRAYLPSVFLPCLPRPPPTGTGIPVLSSSEKPPPRRASTAPLSQFRILKFLSGFSPGLLGGFLPASMIRPPRTLFPPISFEFFAVYRKGQPHSEDARVSERFRLLHFPPPLFKFFFSVT